MLWEITESQPGRMARNSLVLANDKCKAKHTERIKRHLLIEEAVGKVMPTDWSKDKPWSLVGKWREGFAVEAPAMVQLRP
eukprot:1160418-Amphidinium_carterae.3